MNQMHVNLNQEQIMSRLNQMQLNLNQMQVQSSTFYTLHKQYVCVFAMSLMNLIIIMTLLILVPFLLGLICSWFNKMHSDKYIIQMCMKQVEMHWYCTINSKQKCKQYYRIWIWAKTW